MNKEKLNLLASLLTINHCMQKHQYLIPMFISSICSPKRTMINGK